MYSSCCLHFILQHPYFSWLLTRKDESPGVSPSALGTSTFDEAPWKSQCHRFLSDSPSSVSLLTPPSDVYPRFFFCLFVASLLGCASSATWACQRVLTTTAESYTLTFDLGWQVNFDLLERGPWDLLNYLLLHVSMFTISPGLHRDRPCHSWKGSKVSDSDISQMWLNM